MYFGMYVCMFGMLGYTMATLNIHYIDLLVEMLCDFDEDIHISSYILRGPPGEHGGSYGRRARVVRRPTRTRFVRMARRVPRVAQNAIRLPQMGPSRADARSGIADYLAGLPWLRLKNQ
ncbi:hypothetical protein SFRURICE_008829 [Spodoptera frugiperda]|nr:hypothetical protein SFRURICE_008829 [Spodoptera frugiperda]